MKYSKNKSIMDLINKRRRQILVHSIIYYQYNDNLISDAKWSEWAKELYDLQIQYPDIADICVMAKEFKNFDPSTGFDLPLDDPWGNKIARRLMLINRDGYSVPLTLSQLEEHLESYLGNKDALERR